MGPSAVNQKYFIREGGKEEGTKGRRMKESGQYDLLDPSTLYLPLKYYLRPRVKSKTKGTQGRLNGSVF